MEQMGRPLSRIQPDPGVSALPLKHLIAQRVLNP